MAQLFKTVALIGKYNSPEIGDSLMKLAAHIQEKGIEVVIAAQTADRIGVNGYRTSTLADLRSIADLAVVLGGDGTMLSIARNVATANIPLVGINRGRLGFLTDVSVDNMKETLDEILAGEFVAEERFLLNAEVYREGNRITETTAFNDVVVSKGAAGRLIEIEVFIDGGFVYSQRSDGLVVATPTGSTAYALSAGGPILHPTLEAMVLVPICPHTLSNRPIAVNSHAEVEILVIHADDCSTHFDGQSRVSLMVGDRVVVRRSPHTIRLLHPRGHSYYDMLRQKLRWGEKL